MRLTQKQRWHMIEVWVRSVICVKVHKAMEFCIILFCCSVKTLILSESQFWHKEWLLRLQTNQTFDQSDGLFVVKFMCWTEWNCYIKSYWWSWPFPFPQCNPYSLRLAIIKGFALFEPGFKQRLAWHSDDGWRCERAGPGFTRPEPRVTYTNGTHCLPHVESTNTPLCWIRQSKQ